MLRALSEPDERDVGPLSRRHRPDVRDADLARDHLVPECGDDRCDERKPVLALVGDQHPQMLGFAVAHRTTCLCSFAYPYSTSLQQRTRVELVRPSPRRADPAPTLAGVLQRQRQEPQCLSPTRSKHSTNLAGRMGRWSAHHRKTAIFGWLAFVFASFCVGTFVIGAKQATECLGPGESGRATKILDEGFKQPAGETVLIQSDSLTTDDPAFEAAITRCRRDCCSKVPRRDATSAPRSTRRTAGRSRQTGARPSSSSRSAATPTWRSTKIDPDPRRDRPGAGGASAALHRSVRRRQRRQGARGSLHGRPEEGRPLSRSRSP